MARYEHIDTNPKLARQLTPGTFEHALSHLSDHELHLGGFDACYKKVNSGAPAYPAAKLLKIVLYAYSRGIVSSRGIEQACREHVTFMALSGNHAPHFTTIAAFVETSGMRSPGYSPTSSTCAITRARSAGKRLRSTASS